MASKTLVTNAARYAELKELAKKVEAELKELGPGLKEATIEAGGKLKLGKVLLCTSERKGATTFDLKGAVADIPTFADAYGDYIKVGKPVVALEFETLP